MQSAHLTLAYMYIPAAGQVLRDAWLPSARSVGSLRYLQVGFFFVFLGLVGAVLALNVYMEGILMQAMERFDQPCDEDPSAGARQKSQLVGPAGTAGTAMRPQDDTGPNAILRLTGPKANQPARDKQKLGERVVSRQRGNSRHRNADENNALRV